MNFSPNGYEPRVVSPNYPHTDYAAFVREVKRRIASGLLVAYNSLSGSLEDINYSSFKAGLSIERDNYRSLQHWWIDAFLKPVYREWLEMSLLSGALALDTRAPQKFMDVRWSPRGWPSIEPLKEAQAAIESIKNGLSSRTKVLAEQGLDLEDIFEDLENEKKLADEHGIEIVDQPAPSQQRAGQNEGKADATPEPGTNGYHHNRLVTVLGAAAGRRS